GTSTFDGLALAWAIAHRLAEHNRSLALFATHYFELTALPAEIEGCANVHFDAVETRSRQGPGIVFLHHVEDGAANRSYGLQVARLAGIPPDTLRQAQRYFARLDKFNTRDDAQHDLFAQMPVAREAGTVGAAAADDVPGVTVPNADRATDATAAQCAPPTELEARLAALDPDTLSPRDALEAIYGLRKLLRG
ncbi:MAG: MutS-related protein, partial [Candidatus Levyibacteriota bacterium]